MREGNSCHDGLFVGAQIWSTSAHFEIGRRRESTLFANDDAVLGEQEGHGRKGDGEKANQGTGPADAQRIEHLRGAFLGQVSSAIRFLLTASLNRQTHKRGKVAAKIERKMVLAASAELA